MHNGKGVKMKLDKKLNQIIMTAFVIAKGEKHEYVTPEHVLLSILMTPEGEEIISALGGDVDSIKLKLKEQMDKNIPRIEDEEIVQSSGFQKILNISATRAASAGKKTISITDMLVAIFDCDECFATWAIESEGIDRYDLINYISHGISPIPNELSIESMFEEEEEKEPDISDFAINLNELAQQGKLSPVVGRKKELDRTIQVLCRKTKHNPLHVGEPGVGKTAITEGLAQLIVKGKVPKPLKDNIIYRLDLSSMIAGTKYRGDFEQRIKVVLKTLAKRKNVILFIDEIHTIVGAGAVGGGNLDAANILKPMLSSNEIKCIGATTYDEFRKHFEKDKALTRRFQKIDIPEPSKEETLKILQGIIKDFEKFHSVTYSEDSILTAYELSKQYINDRFLPDKAIDVIDEAGSLNRLLKRPKKTIYPQDIAKVVSSISRIPLSTISIKETEILKTLEKRIKRYIFGQNEAVKSVVEAIKRAKAGFNNPEKPIASFLFVGPTGVGKTELAKILSKELGISLHRFDMSEYQEKHTVAKFVGAPPGYVGFEEGGLLTETVIKNPHGILLLDEIEKAHKDIFNSLLQIMDYATLTDNNGRKADFRNTIIIMTSNAGAREIGKQHLGFGEKIKDSSEMTKAVEETFAPEFQNRIDKIIKFKHLEKATILEIVKKEIAEFAETLAKKHIYLKVTSPAVSWFAKKGFSKKFGAREISRIIQNNLKDLLIDRVLFGDLKTGGTIKITVKNGEIELINESKKPVSAKVN